MDEVPTDVRRFRAPPPWVGAICNGVAILLVLFMLLASLAMGPLDGLVEIERTAVRVAERNLLLTDAMIDSPAWLHGLVELMSGVAFDPGAARAATIEDIEEVIEYVEEPGTELQTFHAELLEGAGPQTESDGASLGPRKRVVSVMVVSAMLQIAFIVFGLALAIAWFLRGRPDIRVADGLVTNAWPPFLGTVVLTGGLCLAAVVMVHLGVIEVLTDLPITTVCWPTLAIAIPFLVLVRVFLLGPNGRGFASAFGLAVPRKRWGRVAMLGLAAMGLEAVVAWVLFVVASRTGLEPHWTEMVMEDGIWGSRPLVVMEAIDGIIWAPIIEEIGFRGVLYVTLRTRLRPWPAALISGALFAVAHPYSILGLVTIAWGAVLWSWIYEKTGSLWPAILSHFTGNLIAIGSTILFYR